MSSGEARSVIVDTNLLLLLVVGTLDPVLIASHKRLAAFDETDYNLLVAILGTSRKLVITPHILTETSNLLRQIGEPRKTELTAALAHCVLPMSEESVESNTILHHQALAALGVADTAIVEASKAVDCVLTDDLRLYLFIEGLQRAVVNFTHVRRARFG